MIRGTTPTLQFTMPFDTSILSCLYLTLAQRGATILEKCLDDCDCNGAEVTCKLTQADTLKINAKHPVDFQVRAKTVNDDALASQIVSLSAGRILKDGEI